MDIFARLWLKLKNNGDIVSREFAVFLSESDNPHDTAWAVYLLAHGKRKTFLTLQHLKECTLHYTSFPSWLIQECIEHNDNVLETLSLVIPSNKNGGGISLSSIMKRLHDHKSSPLQDRMQIVLNIWKSMSRREIIVFNRIITGRMRPLLPHADIAGLLADHRGIHKHVLTQRISLTFDPRLHSLPDLLRQENNDEAYMCPYPFAPIAVIDDRSLLPKKLLRRSIWTPVIGGRRVQIINYDGDLLLWTESDGIVPAPSSTAAYSISARVPDNSVLEGYIQSESPHTVQITDILREGGKDLRKESLSYRFDRLQRIKFKRDEGAEIATGIVPGSDLRPRADSASEWNGLLIRPESSRYPDENKIIWYLLKSTPHSILAVLLYVENMGKNIFNSVPVFTFGVWREDSLIPIVKTARGLGTEDHSRINAHIADHVQRRYGPVRSVEPQLVFEIGFDDIHTSKRLKGGVELTEPRVMRWRRDKKISDADTLQRVKDLLQQKRNL